MSEQKVRVCMPMGMRHGWGIAGINTVKELAKLTSVEVVTPDYHQIMRDPFIGLGDNSVIMEKINGPASTDLIGGIPQHGDDPCISAISGPSLRPICEDVSGSRNVGYTFFEDDAIASKAAKVAHRTWSHIVCGSSWCADVLERSGSGVPVSVGVQGVNANIFRPIPPEENPFFRSIMRKFGQSDHFLVFSGGKFELRKGQDVVIRAMKVIMERHPDVCLVGAWDNIFPASMNTMSLSPLIQYTYDEAVDVRTNIIRNTIANGIPYERFQFVPNTLQTGMADVYSACDLGIFPNRCEGGTNLCLMEFMACEKPTIATNTTGHVDILGPHAVSSYIATQGNFEYRPNGILRGTWPEPSVDDLIEAIEAAYRGRGSEHSRTVSVCARERILRFTWKSLAQELLKAAIGRGAEE